MPCYDEKLTVIVQLPINSGGSTWPWNSAMVVSMLCIGAISWLLFFIVQKRLAKIPIIPMHLFMQRSTLILLLQAPAYDFVWQVDLYFLPLYFQDVRGYTALQTATLLLPLLVTLSVAGAVSGPLMTKFARYVSVSHRFVHVSPLTSLQIWSGTVDRVCVLAARSRTESQLFTHNSRLGRSHDTHRRGHRHRLRAPAW
jgi:hypothetical protein